MKKRLIFNEILKYLDHKNAIVITGMRQVGKTTLMKQIYDVTDHPKLWFDFDNPLDTLYFENNDYNSIYELLKQKSGAKNERLYIFIDEIQNLPEITTIIKYMIDHFGVKFIVTGSSNYYMKNLFPESLSGRKFLNVLNPLSFTEFLYFKNKIEISGEIQNEFSIENKLKNYSLLEYKQYENDFSEFMEFGGFPEVVMTQDIKTKREVLKNIFTSFFEKDIKILSDFKDVRDLRDLILLLVPRTGNMIDISRLSSELGVNRVKLYNYLELLQGVFLIKLIPKYSDSIDKSVAGGKKVYFADNGLLKIIGNINDGQLLENTVANQLSNYGEIAFYNKRNTAEIDFILNKQIAFEVKLRTTERDFKKTQNLCSKIGIKDFWLVSLKYSETQKTIFPMFL
ncbi:ATP-binding protein [Bacteroidetes/Chlorobi group bacterium ChocPot_Mid]|nr:MAG: ATP-binding protein [Bacteroidetes/Chlorobi group bacterium ChocPot_Mid]